MPHNYINYAIDGNFFMYDYIYEMKLEKTPEKAVRILPAVLHALRDTISTQESIQLLSQLPLYLKCVYVNGWNTKTPKQNIKTLKEYINAVRWRNHDATDYEVISDELAERYVLTTFNILKKYLLKGEIQDIRSLLPIRFKSTYLRKKIKAF